MYMKRAPLKYTVVILSNIQIPFCLHTIYNISFIFLFHFLSLSAPNHPDDPHFPGDTMPRGLYGARRFGLLTQRYPAHWQLLHPGTARQHGLQVLRGVAEWSPVSHRAASHDSLARHLAVSAGPQTPAAQRSGLAGDTFCLFNIFFI